MIQGNRFIDPFKYTVGVIIWYLLDSVVFFRSLCYQVFLYQKQNSNEKSK